MSAKADMNVMKVPCATANADDHCGKRFGSISISSLMAWRTSCFCRKFSGTALRRTLGEARALVRTHSPSKTGVKRPYGPPYPLDRASVCAHAGPLIGIQGSCL